MKAMFYSKYSSSYDQKREGHIPRTLEDVMKVRLNSEDEANHGVLEQMQEQIEQLSRLVHVLVDNAPPETVKAVARSFGVYVKPYDLKTFEEEGAEAFKAGVPITESPYLIFYEDGLAWMKGYKTAAGPDFKEES